MAEDKLAHDGEIIDTVCSVRDLSVAYHAEPVLEHVTMDIPRGQVVGIVGPNGAGKSTLLKAMLGLVPLLTGSTTFFGQCLDAVRSRVGYMPQAASVDWDFPATVQDVVLMGTYGSLGWLRRPGKTQKATAYNAMVSTGIAHLAKRQIGQLSGGQRQRTFLARAIAQQPDLFFMDEPFQGVDARSESAIVQVLQDLRANGKTIVLVHHDLTTLEKYCDWVALLNVRLQAFGPVKTTFTPELVQRAYGLGGLDHVFGSGDTSARNTGARNTGARNTGARNTDTRNTDTRNTGPGAAGNTDGGHATTPVIPAAPNSKASHP